MNYIEEGDPASKICMIGEAGARAEVLSGRPFIGPSGEVLNSCLMNGGISRRECYLTNLFPSPVTKDRVGNIFYDGDKIWDNKIGLTKNADVHVQNLKARLDKCGANVFVPLGGAAAQAIIGDKRILSWRGSILGSELLGGRKAIATIHPAAVMRGQYTWRYLIISDFKRVRREKMFPELRLTERQLIINPSYSEVISFLNFLATVKAVNFDIEIYNGSVSCISFADSPRRAIAVPFIGATGGPRWTTQEECEIWLAIAKILENPTIMKINQNIIFDISFLMLRNNIRTRGPIGDTMILFGIMYPGFRKRLEVLCSLFTDVPYYKDDKKIWNRISEDPTRFWLYSARDSVVPFECWLKLKAEAEKTGYMSTYNFTAAQFDPLLYMIIRGIKVDQTRLRKSRDGLITRINDYQKELDDIVGREFNPNSSKQCIQLFYGEKGYHPYLNRKTGNVTVDDTALQRIIRKYDSKEARLVQRLRGLNKAKSSYYDIIFDRDGRLRSMWNAAGTWTGRLSSGTTVEGTGTNAQTLTTEFKDFIVADEG